MSPSHIYDILVNEQVQKQYQDDSLFPNFDSNKMELLKFFNTWKQWSQSQTGYNLVQKNN